MSDLSFSHANRQTIRLTDEQRAAIVAEYSAGGVSYSKLARKYEVTDRAIQTVIENARKRRR
jgi:transposase-like protein